MRGRDTVELVVVPFSGADTAVSVNANGYPAAGGWAAAQSCAAQDLVTAS